MDDDSSQVLGGSYSVSGTPKEAPMYMGILLGFQEAEYALRYRGEERRLSGRWLTGSDRGGHGLTP